MSLLGSECPQCPQALSLGAASAAQTPTQSPSAGVSPHRTVPLLLTTSQGISF